MTGLGLGFSNFGCGGVGGVGDSGWVICGVMSVRVMSLDSLCRWQVQVSV